jgi:hypothetical protein
VRAGLDGRRPCQHSAHGVRGNPAIEPTRVRGPRQSIRAHNLLRMDFEKRPSPTSDFQCNKPQELPYGRLVVTVYVSQCQPAPRTGLEGRLAMDLQLSARGGVPPGQQGTTPRRRSRASATPRNTSALEMLHSQLFQQAKAKEVRDFLVAHLALDIDEVRGSDGLTALHIVASTGSKSVAKALLQACVAGPCFLSPHLSATILSGSTSRAAKQIGAGHARKPWCHTPVDCGTAGGLRHFPSFPSCSPAVGCGCSRDIGGWSRCVPSL